MIWTVIGLLIAAAVAIEGAVSNEKKSPAVKLFLIVLALAGLFVAWVAAYQDSVKKTEAENSAKANKQLLDHANQQLENQGKLLELVSQTVGDLGTLNRLAAGEKYYVRIAAGPRHIMEDYLTGIEQKFRGARSSGLLSVRPMSPDCDPEDQHRSCYALVFGSNLNPAAAEVFERFANENGFPPKNDHAFMEPEPARQ